MTLHRADSEIDIAHSIAQVRVNWREASKAMQELKEGDVVSIRGKGRLEIGEVGTSKKDRFVVKMTRYV